MDAEQDPDRRALHMALAAVGPDEELAAALEQSAAQARARGGYSPSRRFSFGPPTSPPTLNAGAGRLLAAAHAAFLAGNAGYSESLLHQARPDLVDPIEKAHAQRLDGDLRYPLGQPHLAPSLLLEAARAFEPLDRVLSSLLTPRCVLDLWRITAFTEGTTEVEIAQTALESLRAQSTPPTAADILLKGVALRHFGHYADAVPAMRDAVRAQATHVSRADDPMEPAGNRTGQRPLGRGDAPGHRGPARRRSTRRREPLSALQVTLHRAG